MELHPDVILQFVALHHAIQVFQALSLTFVRRLSVEGVEIYANIAKSLQFVQSFDTELLKSNPTNFRILHQELIK